jgi:hypothetical protein
MQYILDTLLPYNLEVLGYTSDKFTRHNGWIRERLDRAMCNDTWRNKFLR